LTLGSKIVPAPSGISVFKTSINVDRSRLLEYERNGRAFLSKSKFSRYLIPKEVTNVPNFHTLEAQWVLPWPQADKSSSGSILQRFRPQRVESYVRVHNLNSGPKKMILYLHGGAYILGSASFYISVTGTLAKETNLPILAVDYRLAPESPFPSALHDAFAAYLWLIDPTNPIFGPQKAESLHEPFLPESIIICGDSAGGGLCAALLNYLNLYLRDPMGKLLVPYPRAAVLLSPWVDLSCSAQSYTENGEFDVLPFKTSDIHSPMTENVQVI
jgi:acetyl esterase/lipase